MWRMKRRDILPLAFGLLFPPVPFFTSSAQQIIPLWPHGTPEPAQTTAPEQDVTKPTDGLISGHRTARITNVTIPTMTVYAPAGKATEPHAAALVFPGGGYTRLAWDGEGVDTCKWLTSIGLTCVLVKYRVPDMGHYPQNYGDLEDAQQAMRITRAHADEWHIDPAKIGVVGFSAGGNLAVLMSTHPDERHVQTTPASADADAKIDPRANFAIVVYPAYLAVEPEKKELDPEYTPNRFTPPTFLIQAENDKSYGPNSLVYYRALMDAHVPAELHLYATGGHGFGMHPSGMPEEHWSQTAAAWLRRIGMLSEPTPRAAPGAFGSAPVSQCPVPQPPGAGKQLRQEQSIDDPVCW
jgi:acetyl esterase/lipase